MERLLRIIEMNKKFTDRKLKMNRLNAYFEWLDRDKSQEYIDESNWLRFYFMRENKNRQHSESFIPKPNIIERYLDKYSLPSSYITDDDKNNFEYFDYYDLKYIIKAYRNRTEYKKYINEYGVKIGNRYFNPNQILKYLKVKKDVDNILELIKIQKI